MCYTSIEISGWIAYKTKIFVQLRKHNNEKIVDYVIKKVSSHCLLYSQKAVGKHKARCVSVCMEKILFHKLLLGMTISINKILGIILEPICFNTICVINQINL